MNLWRTTRRHLSCAILLAGMASASSAFAEEIVVSQYPVAPGGFVYAIALEKGFFKQAGPTSRASSDPAAVARRSGP